MTAEENLGALTFSLDLLTVGGDEDTLDLLQLHVFGDLSQPHDQPALGLGLGGVLLVDALLETHQLLQQQGHALVDLLVQHLVTVPAGEQTHGPVKSTPLTDALTPPT